MKWDYRYMSIANEVASWSKDPSTKVGAVITTVDATKIISTGYNGFPRGFSDDPAGYENREYKYPRVVHAEVNAVLNAACALHGTTLYCTHPCCSACASVIVNAGIKRVVFTPPSQDFYDRYKTAMEITYDIFTQCGVKFIRLPSSGNSL